MNRHRLAGYRHGAVDLGIGIDQGHQGFEAVGQGFEEKSSGGWKLNLDGGAKWIEGIFPQVERLLAKDIAGSQVGNTDQCPALPAGKAEPD